MRSLLEIQNVIFMSWFSIIGAARERSAKLPELDTSAFRPPESPRLTTNKDIEEFVRQVQASNSKRKRESPRVLEVFVVFVTTDRCFLRCSPQETPPEARELCSKVVVQSPQTV